MEQEWSLFSEIFPKNPFATYIISFRVINFCFFSICPIRNDLLLYNHLCSTVLTNSDKLCEKQPRFSAHCAIVHQMAASQSIAVWNIFKIHIKHSYVHAVLQSWAQHFMIFLQGLEVLLDYCFNKVICPQTDYTWTNRWPKLVFPWMIKLKVVIWSER